MRKVTLLTLTMLLGLLFHVKAQDDETSEALIEDAGSGLDISGSVDAYYRYAPYDQAPPTAFADQTGFNIGMANLIVSQEGAKAGFVADLAFGPRGYAASNYGVAGFGGVNQLYAFWKATDDLTLTFGNFNTFLGYEVISPAANFHYSTSYMFSYGPFSHTGLRADYALTDEFSVMLAVMNPTDLSFADYEGVDTYTLGFQLGYVGEMGGAWLNAVYGDQDGTLDGDEVALGDFSAGSTFQIDLTTGWNLTDAFYLGLNTTYNTTSGGETASLVDGDLVIEDADIDGAGFFGIALYPEVSLSDNFAIGLRGEYFSDADAVTLGGFWPTMDADGNTIAPGGSVMEYTLSANISTGNLTWIPELRYDVASEDTFFNGYDGEGNPEYSNGLFSALLAAVYAF